MGNFRKYESAMSSLIQTRGQVDVLSERAKYSSAVWQEKERQKEDNFAAVAQLIAAGKSLYDNYSDNTKLSDFARTKLDGVQTKDTIWSKFFGKTKFFQKDGSELSTEDIRYLMMEDQKVQEKSLYDLYLKGKDK